MIFFLTKPFQCIFKHIRHGRKGPSRVLLHNQNRSFDKHQAKQQIGLNVFYKRRISRQVNGGTSHFVLCETKLNNLSMLCMTICLCCVWKNFYFVYDNLSILCMTFFYYSFLFIVFDNKSQLKFSIDYLIHFIFLGKKIECLSYLVCMIMLVIT